jgi:hypothetical protein
MDQKYDLKSSDYGHQADKGWALQKDLFKQLSSQLSNQNEHRSEEEEKSYKNNNLFFYKKYKEKMQFSFYDNVLHKITQDESKFMSMKNLDKSDKAMTPVLKNRKKAKKFKDSSNSIVENQPTFFNYKGYSTPKKVAFLAESEQVSPINNENFEILKKQTNKFIVPILNKKATKKSMFNQDEKIPELINENKNEYEKRQTKILLSKQNTKKLKFFAKSTDLLDNKNTDIKIKNEEVKLKKKGKGIFCCLPFLK